MRGWSAELGWAEWGCYPLLPWSNRIPGGTFLVAGRRVRVPVNWPDGTAIHGLVADVEWEVVSRSARRVVLEVDVATAPYRLRAAQAIELADGRVDLSLGLENRGAELVPVGLGIHPWFRSGRIRVPARQRWPGEPIPTGPPVSVEAAGHLRDASVPPLMDRCYTGLVDASADVPGARLSWTGPIEHVVVYTGEPGWVAVEPVTMANDGFGLAERGVSGHGVQWLAPGDGMTVSYAFERAAPR